MSSTGQAIGMVVGAVIGFFIPGGYIMLGAAIGGMIGSAIDPPKGPDGPRLNDLSVQLVGYGNPIPRIYGTIATMGTIFWVENNALKETEEDGEGGKGGGGAPTIYKYSATFALALCKGPIYGVRRIWIAGKLVYDHREPTAIYSAEELVGSVVERLFVGLGMANEAVRPSYSIYLGTDEQAPDPRMQADLGVADTSAYRGLAYIVFNDLDLTDYGNTLMGAQIKVEVMESATFTQGAETILQVSTTGSTIFDASKFDQALDGTPSPELIVDSETIRGAYLPEHTGVRFADVDPGTSATTAVSIDFWANVAVSRAGSVTSLLVDLVDMLGGGRIFQINTRADSIDSEIIEIYVDPSSGLADTIGPYLVVRGWHHFAVDLDGTDAILYIDGVFTATWTKTGALGISLFDVLVGNQAATLANGSDAVYIRRLRILQGARMFPAEFSPGLDEYVNYPYPIDATSVTPGATTLGDIVSDEALSSNMMAAGDIDVTALTQEVRGYMVATTGTIRSALEPLQAAWPFDVVPHGYKLKFVPRGGTSIATISADELGAASPDVDAVVRVTHEREMDSQVPRKVVVVYHDVDREYNTGEQSAERLNTEAISTARLELPVVFTATEAAGKAEVLLYVYWMERQKISFVLPPTYAHLEPADVVTINLPAATYIVRLITTNLLPDGRVECSAAYSSSAIYTPAAIGETGTVLGQRLSGSWLLTGVPMDIPCVGGTATDAPGLVFGVVADASFNGATLVYSTDDGVVWNTGEQFRRPTATVATAVDAPTANRFSYVDDSVLTIRAGSGVWYSCTFEQMLAGSNHVAWGTNGRWEIIAYQNATDNLDGTYTLDSMLRGRFGTEANSALHRVGDQVILLTLSTLRFQPLGLVHIGRDMLYRVVGPGRAIDSASNIYNTYTAQNLMPLAVINAAAAADTAGNWTIQWVRQTRLGWEWRDGADAALGETGENYEIDVYSDSSFATIKRTLTSTSQSVPYTIAQSTTDFGGQVQNLYCRIYQMSSTVRRGAMLQATFNDPLYIRSKTVLALNFEDADGATTFTELTGKSVSAAGNAGLCSITTTGPKTGGGCMNITWNATIAYMKVLLADSAAIAIAASEDFTQECWVNFASNTPLDNALFGFDGIRTSTWCGGSIIYKNIGTVGFAYATGPDYVSTTGHTTLFNATWRHIAITRKNNILRIFIDGVKRLERANTTCAIAASGQSFLFGGNTYYSHSMNGKADGIRILKGLCLYEADFTPSTTLF